MAAPSQKTIHAVAEKTPAPSYGHLLNLPNFLTLCRLGSIPIFLTFLTRQRYTEALYVFVAAAITDGLDGAVARWFNSRTELGAFLDPFADKLMLVSAFVVLTIDRELPGYLLSVVVIRDVVIVVGYLMISFFSSAQFLDLATFDSRLAQNLVGMLAELGRNSPHLHRRFGESSARTHGAHFARARMLINREAFVLDDFRILQERLVVV